MMEQTPTIPRMDRVLARAGREAAAMGIDRIGTEHVLLALAEDTSGIAGQVLEALGVREATLRKLREITGSPGYLEAVDGPMG